MVGHGWHRRSARRKPRGFVMAAALPALNLADAAFTLLLLQAGLASEANPAMRLAFDHSPLAFLAAKLLLVNVGAAALWVLRRRALAGVGLQMGLAAYASVVAYHLFFVGNYFLTGGKPLP